MNYHQQREQIYPRSLEYFLTNCYIIVFPSLVQIDSSFFREAIHFSHFVFDFCSLLRSRSSSRLRGFSFTFVRIAACCSQRSSISALSSLVRRMASQQLSTKLEISQNSSIRVSQFCRYFCSSAMVFMCGLLEAMLKSWTMLNSWKEQPMIFLTSWVTFISSSISLSNSFSSCSSCRLRLNSTFFSLPPTNFWQIVLVKSYTELVQYLMFSRAVLCSMNSPFVSEKLNYSSKRKCRSSLLKRILEWLISLSRYFCSSLVRIYWNSCVQRLRFARKFLLGSRGRTYPPQFSIRLWCRNQKSLNLRLTIVSQLCMSFFRDLILYSLQLVRQPSLISSGFSSSTTLSIKKSMQLFSLILLDILSSELPRSIRLPASNWMELYSLSQLSRLFSDSMVIY